MTTILNKRILLSLGMIVFVAVAAIGATGAFFSDTETSTGNTFTAGAIDLQVDNDSYYNGQPNSGTSWAQSDLNGSQLFFNFGDLKPGDWGEDTISLHVNNNDAYACVDVRLDSNNDNSITEPEGQDGDSTGGAGEGELADAVNFIWWADDGDNVLEDDEDLLDAGPLGNLEVGEVATVALADSSDDSVFESEDDLNDGALAGSETYYIGKAWCFGEIGERPIHQDGSSTAMSPAGNNNEDTASGTPEDGGFTCDGSDEDNSTQTDTLTATISFMAVQSRNNGEFVCAPHLVGENPTIAASYATGFEPSPFSVGNINGQDGWEKTGPYDAAVVSSPVIADLQSLRISNAVTSGAFGDQTFAPELASGAGETGVGTGTTNHFEAEFKISTTQPTEQSGLALSVSPDNGSGSRMSYLSFADEAGGVRVTFYDVTNTSPIGTVASFNPTDLGLITRSSHTIKFVMDFVNGPANDIVKIYIDGSLVKTGTSWEDYYRYDPEQTGSGNVLSAVDTLIFRASGAAVPANSGKGFLFDNVSLSSSSI